MFRITTLALIAGVCAPAPAIAQQVTTITRGTVSTTAAEWPDIVARKKGFYEKERLKVDQAIISPTTITSSLIGGSVQIGFIGGSAMVQAIEAGRDRCGAGGVSRHALPSVSRPCSRSIAAR